MAGWAGLDGNPLRRRIDRVERGLWVILVLVFFSAAPVIVTFAGHVASTESRAQLRAERSWRQVDAVLLRRAPGRLYGYSSAMTVWAEGRWHAPEGGTRSGLVPAEPAARPGTVVRIWVNRAGQLTGRRPLTAGTVTVRIVAFEVLAVTVLAVVALLLAWSVRWLTDKRRLTYWEIEWACFGPRWSARHLAADGSLNYDATPVRPALLDHCWQWMVGFRA